MRGLVPCLLAGMICGSTLRVDAQNIWEWQFPSPQGNVLHDVDTYPPNSAIAVGDQGSLLRTVDGGATWTASILSGLPNLRAVCFLDALVLVSVGLDGVILRSTDAGNSWSPQSSGTTENLLDVDFADSLHGLAVGQNGTILRSNDGGVTWSPQTSGTSVELRGACLVDSDTGTVVGASGTVLRTVDGGANWSPQVSGTTFGLWSVDFVDASTGMATGSSYILFDTPVVIGTTDGGATWLPLPIPVFEMPYNVGPRSIEMLSASDAFIAGVYRDDSIHLEEGILLQTHDAGASWTWATEPNNLLAVAMFSVSEGIAVGAAGTVRGISGGNLGPMAGGGDQNFMMQAVDFFDPQHGVAVASEQAPTVLPDRSSRMYVTSNGGTSWNVITGFGWIALFDVAFADAMTVYAVGHGPFNLDAGATVFRSTDGGMTWQQFWGSCCFPCAPTCIKNLYAVDFANPDAGVAVGSGNMIDGAILTILNGVGTWEPTPTTGPLHGVSVPSSQVAYAVGENGVILKSQLGTGVWSLLTSGTSAHLNDVCFTDDLTGTVVGSGGLILRTTDGGITWTPQTSPATEGLREVSFIDANNGIILSYSWDSSALLKTVDGGTTWVQDEIPLGYSETSGAAYGGVVYIDGTNVCTVGGDESILARRDLPIAVFIQDFTAQSQSGSVELQWSVFADETLLGFRLYRSANGGSQSVIHRELIAPSVTSYVDRTVQPGVDYEYLLAVVHLDGSESRSYAVSARLPEARASLAQNEPNPFNPATRIRFTLPERMPVELSIFDTAGHRIATLLDETRAEGEHVVVWNGRDDSGNRVRSGIYFYQLRTLEREFARKMVLLR